MWMETDKEGGLGEEEMHPGKSAPRPMTIAVASLSSVPPNGKPILKRMFGWFGNEC